MTKISAQKKIKGVCVVFLFLLSTASVEAQENLRRFLQAPTVVHDIPYGANPAAGSYVEVGDAKIYYEVYGKGQPVVLLHGGLFGSTIEMAGFIRHLQNDFQVIAISTRGHGKSELGKEPLTLAQRASDAMAVINAVTREKAILIGFSDGGYTAYKIGAMYPERVKKMIVIGAGILYPGLRTFDMDAKRAIAMDTAYWKQQLALMPEPERLEEVFAQVAHCYGNLTVGRELLDSIQCPVLLMAGDRDDGNSVENVVQAARMIKQAQICILPNGSHTAFLENFEAAWASTAPFLETPAEGYMPMNADLFKANQVSYALVNMGGQDVVRVVKDPSVKAVDEPTFLKINGIAFKDGEIEVKVLSRLLPNAPEHARGFIGVAFRIADDNAAFESIYVRPTNGRAAQQVRRNHAIQYFSYPDYKFDRLRKESPEQYESYADMGLNEWITLNIKVSGTQAKLFLNGHPEPNLIVNDLKKGAQNSGGIGLWVEEGTEGYFKDLKITVH